MKEDTIEISLESVGKSHVIIALKDGAIIKNKKTQTIKIQETDIFRYIATSDDIIELRTVHYYSGSPAAMRRLLDFIGKNNATITSNDCPYKLDDVQMQVVYCFCIKQMDYAQIGKELGKARETIANIMTKVYQVMDITNPFKMNDSFIKYHSHYIYSSGKQKGKPRGKSGNNC